MTKLKLGIDVTLWNETIAEYVAFTKKSSEEAIFRQAKNLLFFLSKEMPQSRFRKGQYVSRLSDYFKYRTWVAGMLVAKYFKRKGAMIVKLKYKRKGETGRAFLQQGSRGRYKFAGWQGKNRTAVYFTKEMAIKENERRRRMINARLGFAQLIPMKAVDALKIIAARHGFNIGNLRIQGNKPNRKWQGENAFIAISKTDKRIDLTISSAYTFKTSKTMFGKSQDMNAQFYDNAIEQALPRAMVKTIADIRGYMAQKMAERAQKLNK